MTDSKTNSAYCIDLVRRRDRARYAAALFVPEPSRRAIFALGAFNVEIADVAVHVSQPMAGEVRLQWWHDALAGEEHGDAGENPVLAELRVAAARHALPVERLMGLVDAHRVDLYADPMQSMDALRAYLDDTVGTLYLMTALILGVNREEADMLAHHAGMAAGLASVMAALPAHAARGQIFLPADFISAFGVDPGDILAARSSPQFVALLAELRSQAQSHLDAANDLLQKQTRTVRAGFLLLAVTQKLLQRLGETGADPFDPRPLSPLQTLWLLWRASKRK